ncbi:autophagy protein 6 [Scheffersomyces spartinae]|uniref:Autophagy protein 6 n=1 Tax=Scheffersomyces spartinae TaxID=45513 RepID=A0A9P7V9J0_9ASCO|nr:autophagy protein 6 [Scheffersomyces spartinae]KAG7193704.1 autophagy protein 6 [Scheffersomyces spartinae]
MTKPGMFYCQKCGVPITVDDSVRNMTPEQFDLIRNSTSRAPTNQDSNESDPSTYIPKSRLELYQSLSDSNLDPSLIVDNISGLNDSRNDATSTTDKMTVNSSFIVIDDVSPTDSSVEIGKYGDESTIAGNSTTDNDILLPANSSDQIASNPEDGFNLSKQINELTKIFEILSKDSLERHPLCIDCSGLLMDNLKLKFDLLQKEKDNYLNFLRKLREKDRIIDGDSKFLDSKLAKSVEDYEELVKKRETALKELRDLEQYKRGLDDNLVTLKNEIQELSNSQLNDLLLERNKFQLDILKKTNEIEKVKAYHEANLNQLDHLRTLNVYTNFFNISFKGQYATINDLRLGYKVPLPEVNAALGNVALLMDFIIRTLKVEISGFKIVPSGPQSYIMKLAKPVESVHETQDESKKIVLNLFATTEFSLGAFFNFNKLDVAMIALLEILCQIQLKMRSTNRDVELPYNISAKRDSIGNRSIRITSNHEWSEGCRHLLTNLNWILAYSTVNS